MTHNIPTSWYGVNRDSATRQETANAIGLTVPPGLPVETHGRTFASSDETKEWMRPTSEPIDGRWQIG
jgi:hypothetical protein